MIPDCSLYVSFSYNGNPFCKVVFFIISLQLNIFLFRFTAKFALSSSCEKLLMIEGFSRRKFMNCFWILLKPEQMLWGLKEGIHWWVFWNQMHACFSSQTLYISRMHHGRIDCSQLDDKSQNSWWLGIRKGWRRNGLSSTTRNWSASDSRYFNNSGCSSYESTLV